MSTILKALKKLESDSAPKASPPEPEKRSPSKVAIGKDEVRSKKRILMASTGCLILVLLWAGHRLFFTPSSTPEVATRAVSDQHSIDSTPKENNAPDIKTKFTAPVNKPAVKPTTGRPQAIPDARPPLSAFNGRRPLPVEKPAERAARRPTAGSKPADIQFFDDPRLQLQAIAWSAQAKDRIAVINGSLVREGGQVKGVTVIEIGLDEVAFEEGGRRWKQKF